MVAIPTVPAFVANDTSLIRLQQLSTAVAFLSDCDIKPVMHMFKNSSAAILAGTWTTLPGGSIAYDNDNMLGGSASSFSVTIQTRGYYAAEACAPWLTGATAIQQKAAFLFTAGSSNPNFALNATSRFGIRGGNSCSTATTDTCQVISAMVPMGLYPGDKIAFQIWTDTAATVNNNVNANYVSGRFVPNFTMTWIRTAP